MSTPVPSTRPIVVGIDGSPAGDRAVWWAANQAAAERAPLLLVHVRAGSTGVEHLLAAARARASAGHPGLTVETRDAHGDASEVLLQAAETARMVVVGVRGSTSRRRPGAVRSTLVQRAACPVVVVRSLAIGTRGRGVAVGVDGSDGSPAVLREACRIAEAARLDLRVIHCVGPDDETDGTTDDKTDDETDDARAGLELAELVAGVRQDHPDLLIDLEVRRTRPEHALREVGEVMDVLVVGRHDGALPHHGGTIADHLAHHAPTTVMVVPARDRTTADPAAEAAAATSDAVR